MTLIPARLRALFATPFPGSNSPTWPHAQPQAGPVEYAFTSGGRAYFRFVSDANLPQTRYHAAQDFLLELSFRTSREYLTAHYAAILAAVNAGKLAEIAVLTTEAQKRLDWITDTGLMFKLASCYYFTADDDPARYDRGRGMQHVAHWQQHETDLPAFFLQTRLTSLLPSQDFVESSILSFTKSSTTIEAANLRAITSLLSNAPDASELMRSTLSQAEALESWSASLSSASPSGAAGS